MAEDGDKGHWGDVIYTIDGDGIPIRELPLDSNYDNLHQLYHITELPWNASSEVNQRSNNVRVNDPSKFQARNEPRLTSSGNTAHLSRNKSKDMKNLIDENTDSGTSDEWKKESAKEALALLESEVYNVANPDYSSLPAFTVHPYSGTVFVMKVRLP